jgi:hypothetical protein
MTGTLLAALDHRREPEDLLKGKVTRGSKTPTHPECVSFIVVYPTR